MKKSTFTAIVAAVFALSTFVSCNKKDEGCYTCNVYNKGKLQNVETICDENQIESYKKAMQGAKLAVKCTKQ